MRCGFTYKAHDADQIGDKDVRRQHSLLQNAFPGAGNNPHAGQLQVQAGSAGKREKTFSGSSEKDGAPQCDNGRWHRDLSQVFQRDTRMHVQAFVSRVVRMPASGVKSPIATSNVKRTRQLLQGRNVGMGGGKHCLFTRAPVSQVAAIFVSCFLSVAFQERTGLGTGDRLGKQGADHTLVCCVRSRSPWTLMARLLVAGGPDTGS